MGIFPSSWKHLLWILLSHHVSVSLLPFLSLRNFSKTYLSLATYFFWSLVYLQPLAIRFQTYSVKNIPLQIHKKWPSRHRVPLTALWTLTPPSCSPPNFLVLLFLGCHPNLLNFLFPLWLLPPIFLHKDVVLNILPLVLSLLTLVSPSV